MKINDNRKVEVEKPKAEAGDLIKIDNDVCLVVNKLNWESKYVKGDLAVVLLSYDDGKDWMELSDGAQKYFENGDYDLFAKTGTWEINIE